MYSFRAPQECLLLSQCSISNTKHSTPYTCCFGPGIRCPLKRYGVVMKICKESLSLKKGFQIISIDVWDQEKVHLGIKTWICMVLKGLHP